MQNFELAIVFVVKGNYYIRIGCYFSHEMFEIYQKSHYLIEIDFNEKMLIPFNKYSNLSYFNL